MRKFINIISEALRPTATKTATAHDLDSLFGPDTSHQQVATAAPSAVPAAVAAPRNAGGAHTRAAVASGMRNVNTGNIMRDLANHAATHDFHDEISDEQARLNAGHDEQDYVAALGNTGAAQLGAPVAGVLAPAYPVTPDNLPTVIHQQLMAHGEFEDTFDPEWHQIRHLPGYMQTMIRSIGRRVFSQFTTTPIEDINMICEILNRPIDVQKMATWIVRNGHKEDEMTMDFGDIVPGFTADCTLWRAGGVQYLIMRDVGGHYIYAWPETVREVSNRTAPTGQNAAQIGQTRFLEGANLKKKLGEDDKGNERRVQTFPSSDEELNEEDGEMSYEDAVAYLKQHNPPEEVDEYCAEVSSRDKVIRQAKFQKANGGRAFRLLHKGKHEEISEESRPFVIQSSWINHLPSKRMDTKFWEIVSAAMDELGIDKATAGGPEINRAIALVKDKMKSTYDKIDKLRAQAEKIRQKVNGEKGKLPDTPFHKMDETITEAPERYTIVRNSRGYMVRDNEIGVWQTACPTREAAQSWIAAKVEEDKKPKDWKGIRMPVKD